MGYGQSWEAAMDPLEVKVELGKLDQRIKDFGSAYAPRLLSYFKDIGSDTMFQVFESDIREMREIIAEMRRGLS